MPSKNAEIVDAVRERYGAIAREAATSKKTSGCGCGASSDVGHVIGYSEDELRLGEGSNLSLGCGNPLALAGIEPGMTVLDLGSGAGFDAFLAWRKVGASGRVIGVDMTDDMLALARKNAAQLGATNVEFRKGTIEQLPVEPGSVDVVISNCVINLSTEKPGVFREIHRVLKPGGRFAVSDLVLLRPLPASVASDVNAYVGCIAGASLLTDYIRMALDAGLENLSLPQITASKKLLTAHEANKSQPTSCCGSNFFTEAASAVVSANLHGRKPL